jgi:hypothetical protein
MVAYGLPGTGISALIELLAPHQSDNVDDIYTKTIESKVRPKPDLGLFKHLKRHRKITVHSPTELFHRTKKEAFDLNKMQALFDSKEFWAIVFFNHIEEDLAWKAGTKSLTNYLAGKLYTSSGNKTALWINLPFGFNGIRTNTHLKDALPHIVISTSMPESAIDNMWRLNKEVAGEMTITPALNYVTGLKTEVEVASGMEREIPWAVVKATDGHLYSTNPKQRVVHLNMAKEAISSGFYYALVSKDRENVMRAPRVQAMDSTIAPRSFALEFIRQKTPQRICEVGDATAAWDGISPAVKPGKQCSLTLSHTLRFLTLEYLQRPLCSRRRGMCA